MEPTLHTSLHGHSDFEGVPDIPVPATEREANQVEVGPRIREAFRSLDEVDVAHLLKMRAVVMKSPPKFVHDAYCEAMRIALQEIVQGSEARNEDRQGSVEDGNGSCCCKNAFDPPATRCEAPIDGPDWNVCHGPVDAIVDFESGEFGGCEGMRASAC